MKKILYLVSTLQKAGPINQLSYIIKYLDKTKFEPIILTLSIEPKDTMLEYFKDELNVKIDSLKLSRIKGVLKGVSEVKRYIKNNNIDLVHTQGIRADGIIRNINIPKITTLRNYPFYDYPSKFGKVKGKLMVLNHMNIIKSNKKNCIACSKSISEEFKKNNLYLKYIQNGVDTEKYKPLENTQKDFLKEKLNILIDKKIFITVGSLIPRKDMQTVIKGFQKYNDGDSILLIAGDGFKKEILQNIADDNIRFLGNISNVVEYLQISDCFISASLAEGLPNTVLEAMACGLPTILSDIPSHRELYENYEGNFFNTKNYRKLALLMNEVINKYRVEKEKSLEIVNNKFSAEVMSKKYQKLYLEKLNGSV